MALAALLIGIGPLGAQTVTDAAEARRQRDASLYQKEELLQRAKELEAKLARDASERQALTGQLIELAKNIQDSEAQMATLEKELLKNAADEAKIRSNFAANRNTISGLLMALQHMGRNPPPVFLTRREDALAMVRSTMLLAATFPQMREHAQFLSGQLALLVRAMDETRAGTDHLQAETTQLRANQQHLAALIESRNLSMAQTQRELAQVRRDAAVIAKSVSNLTEFVRKLEKLDRAVADRTRMGEYERELAAKAEAAKTAAAANPQSDRAEAGAPTGSQQPVPQPTLQGASPKRVPIKPLDDLRPSITLQPGERLAMATPGRIQPAIPFDRALHQLRLPAQGQLIQGYGEPGQSGHSDGIVIATRAGAQVVSPSDGWVLYAGEFRSYGQILIINAGGGYLVVLAGLSSVSVQVGQFVLAGEPVGIMTTAPVGPDKAGASASTKTQPSAPLLYVEFRKNQRPIDSGPWWAETARKVAG